MANENPIMDNYANSANSAQSANINSEMDLSKFHSNVQSLFEAKESKLRMIDGWVLVDTLGMGVYSKVKSGLHYKTGQKVALKVMFADHTEKCPNQRKNNYCEN